MAQADGSIRIDTTIETKNAEKEYQKLLKTLQSDVDKSANNVTKLTNKFQETKNKLGEVNAQMDELASKIAENVTPEGIDSAQIDDFVTAQIQADAQYKALNSEAIKLEQKASQYASDLSLARDRLTATREKLQKVKNEQSKATKEAHRFSSALKSIQTATLGVQKNTKGISDSISGGIKKITRYGMALLSIRSVYGLLSNIANTWLNSSSKGAKQLKSDIDYMKNAVGQALSPIIKQIVNLLYEALGLVGALVKTFTGINIFAGSYEDYMASAYESASGTTKELKKQLASFDKINKMDDTSSSSGGGGSDIVAPTQDLSSIMEKYSEQAEKIKENFEGIKDAVFAIAGGLIGWKLADFLGLTGKQKLGLSIGLSSLAFYVSGIKGISDGELTADNFMKAFASSVGLGVSAGLLTANWKVGLIVSIGSISFAGGMALGEKIKEYVPDSIDWYIDVVNLDWDHDSVADKVWKVIVIILGTIGDAIVKWITDTATDVTEAGTTFFSEALTQIGLSLQLLLLNILAGIAQVVRGIPIIGEGIADAMMTGINNKKEEVSKQLKGSIDYVSKQNGTYAQLNGRAIGTKLGTGLINTIEEQEGDILHAMNNNLVLTGPAAEKRAKEVGQQIGQAEIQGVSTGITNNQGTILNNVYSVVQASSRVDTSSSETIGSNIVTGVNKGINNNKNSIFTTMANLANSLLGTVKSVLGIHSPSVEMANLAKYIPLGIAEGIDATSDKAVDSMKTLVEDITDTAQGMEDIEYNGVAKLTADAVTYTPKQSISTNAVQNSIASKNDDMMSQLLGKIGTTNNGQKIEVTLNLDGNQLLKHILTLNDNYNLPTNGGGL